MRYLVMMGLLALLGCDSGGDSSTDSGGGAGGAGGAGGEGGEGGGINGCEAEVPAEFAMLTNTLEGNADAIAAGDAIYHGTCDDCAGVPGDPTHFAVECVSCHGATGGGDGVINQSGLLMPPPTAFTEEALPCDGDVVWRISTGGATGPAGSIMIAYGERLSQEQLFQLTSYLRTLAP